MRTKIYWWLNAGLVCGGAVLWLWQQTRTESLRAELAVAQVSAQSSALLQQQNRELREAQPSTSELQTLRDDHETLNRLRAELSQLKNLANDRIASAKPTAKTPPAKTIWPAALPELPAPAWKNAGRATPAASFETTLWAAAGGDVETLASGLLISEPAPIRALMAELPPEERAKYATPEKLVATLMAKDVTMQSIQVLDQVKDSNPDAVHLTVRLQASDGAEREVNFVTYHRPDGWKLVVPNVALAHYVNLVRGMTGTAGK